ncbi:helicase [Streptomyces sp. XY431]|uniref:DEAD/DEAH box helicase n=1 Tax=Streptomyces sp. XY431 TaxID=1415562 RepID=UPI0006AE2D01|nr:DEAD/DEAH box helicase [Streptomyces sp. XY431]KOV13295.1 helicase [Streptomyces sp. XY431]
MPIELRDHQIEAVDAIIRALDIPPGGVIPANGLRAQIHAACGTGKTYISAAAARRLVPRGRTLVLVPTLALLGQTIKAWREVGHTGPAVAVCSMEDDVELWSMDVRCTTNPIRLAMWHGSGPVTIFATYSSLGVLAEAFEGAYGKALDPLDLAVVDEAHRTSGSLGKAWADIHHQHVIPAARRLYATATPRIWQERPVPSWELREGQRHERMPEEMAASMDDEAIFGPVAWKLPLSEAVKRGLLARYQIIVVELTDPVVTPEKLMSQEKRSEEIRGQRLGALQAAMLHTMAQHGLQTLITFHHRTIESQAFAEGLPKVASRLHAADPELYPERIWANWLKGEHAGERRARVLAEFGRSARRAVLSNCRVLGEGVDIRAVDSVALLDPKGAPHDIVQAIGRALRQKPNEGKLASLIVPVFLKEGEAPQDMFTSGSYRPLVNVLQALRAHDEEAVELLAIPQVEQKAEVEPSTDIGPEPQEGEQESRMLLRFSAPRDPVMVARWVSFNVIDTERQDWARGWAAAEKYYKREGHLRVPFDHREETRAGLEAHQRYPLGHWVSEQRKAYAAGQMEGKRIERLESLGMVWDPLDAAWEENLAAAREYFEHHGTLAAPRTATALDKPVGQWLSNQRRPGVLADRPDRVQALAEIDPDWNPAWPLDWQRHYAAVADCLDGGAQLADLLPGVTIHGLDVGRWLERQRQHIVWQGLMDEQRERLAALGVEPLAAPAEEAVPKKKAGAGKVSAFDRGVAALAQYRERTGSVTVPRAHVEELPDGQGGTVEVKLGVWISNTKSRRAKLTEAQLDQLTALGLDWR